MAALGGEWIPVDVLLDYLEIDNKDARDELIDVLDDMYVNTSPALLQCMDWRFVGMSGQGLVYRFQSPLLPALIVDPATRKDLAHKLLVWLQQRWPAPSRNQAAYLLRLANQADREVAQALRERLAWQVEAEFAAELQAHVLGKLESSELSLSSLHQLMAKHGAIWSMPRRRAICQAWFSFYQRSLRDVPAQMSYAGEGWDALWQVADDLPIPATAEGLALCYFYGYVQANAGQLEEAERLFQLGLHLCKKHSDLDMEARFHSIIAHIEYRRGELDKAEERLYNIAIPNFQKLGNTRSVAVAYGRIAGILQIRGQLNEALDIYQTKELPVYETLGDVRAHAVTMGKIADILQVRGQLDEALNIRENHGLPVYEKLGDVDSKAVTMGEIADILQTRNRVDSLWAFIWDKKSAPEAEAMEAALQTLSEIIITFQSLQNAMQIGCTYSQQADIYQVSGRLETALGLREKEIAVFAKSGYAHELLVSHAKLAILLWQMDATNHAVQIRELFGLALAQARQMKIPEAGQIEGIMVQIGLSSD